MRVIRAFKSNLEDLEERRSCQSIQSLQNLRSARNQLQNTTKVVVLPDSHEDTSKNSGVECSTCNSSARAKTPTEEVEGSASQETDLLVPRSPETQSTKKCCYHHHNQQLQYFNSAAVSPQHFNNLVFQSLHFNMAVHSNSLEPPSSPQPIIPELPKLVHEISI